MPRYGIKILKNRVCYRSVPLRAESSFKWCICIFCENETIFNEACGCAPPIIGVVTVSLAYFPPCLTIGLLPLHVLINIYGNLPKQRRKTITFGENFFSNKQLAIFCKPFLYFKANFLNSKGKSLSFKIIHSEDKISLSLFFYKFFLVNISYWEKIACLRNK